jgi:hypothetical protein
MTTNDLHHLPINQPSMCIPRTNDNIDEKQIREIFNLLNLGEIDHVDIIERTSDKGEKYKRVFIHFIKWYCNDDACSARTRLIDGKDIKVVYDNPWFWKISAIRQTPNPKEYKR